jgi:hypothetical protein
LFLERRLDVEARKQMLRVKTNPTEPRLHAAGRILQAGDATSRRASSWKFLRVYGCHELQGYLFSKPLPTDDLVAFVRSWDARAYPSRIPPDALHPFIAV